MTGKRPVAWFATCDYIDPDGCGMRVRGRWLFWTKAAATAFMREHGHRNVVLTPLVAS